MNRVTAKIRATKHAAELNFVEGSWNRQFLRFAISSPDGPHVFRFSKRVPDEHVRLKGQNSRELTFTRGCHDTQLGPSNGSEIRVANWKPQFKKHQSLDGHVYCIFTCSCFSCHWTCFVSAPTFTSRKMSVPTFLCLYYMWLLLKLSCISDRFFMYIIRFLLPNYFTHCTHTWMNARAHTHVWLALTKRSGTTAESQA